MTTNRQNSSELFGNLSLGGLLQLVEGGKLLQKVGYHRARLLDGLAHGGRPTIINIGYDVRVISVH